MEKLRIGIIGFGNRGFSFARTLQTERFRNRAEVAAVYEPQPLKQRKTNWTSILLLNVFMESVTLRESAS